MAARAGPQQWLKSRAASAEGRGRVSGRSGSRQRLGGAALAAGRGRDLAEPRRRSTAPTDLEEYMSSITLPLQLLPGKNSNVVHGVFQRTLTRVLTRAGAVRAGTVAQREEELKATL
ncbi:unnamed protein product [Closterium sp. NIES-65]|nr:unnamed protein product [Closterium sp. NIES-65]